MSSSNSHHNEDRGSPTGHITMPLTQSGRTSTFQENLSQQNQLQHFQSMLKASKATKSGKQQSHKHSRGSSSATANSFTDAPSNRQLLPVLVCLITFATVLSVLVIYMDTTEIRHQQFRLNMTRDYDFVGVSQDDPQLISYLRDIYLRRYSNSLFVATSDAVHATEVIHPHHQHPWDYHDRPELAPRMAQFVVEGLLQGKQNGVFVQSMTGANGRLMTGPWLAGGANWTGIVVEPELRKYFDFRKEMGLQKAVEVVHACVSPNEYPKEVDWRGEPVSKSAQGEEVEEERDEVKINSLLDDEEEDAGDTEAGRVKCFSLLTILLATNRTKVDLLSLGTRGQQLQILQTLPFERVHVEVISLHFAYGEDKTTVDMAEVARFLSGKGFKFVQKMGHSYFYQYQTAQDTVQEEQDVSEGEKKEED